MKKTESLLQCQIVKLFQEKKIFCHSVPNEAAGSNMVRQGQMVTMGLRSGVADLVVWWPTGIGYLEVKAPGGRQSPAQKLFQSRCLENKIRYDLVFSLDDFEKLCYSIFIGD